MKDITERLLSVFPPDEGLSGREAGIQDLCKEAATEIKDVRDALKQIEGVIAELAEAANEGGLRSDTLRLWSRGKMAGGPFVGLGVATPQTCKMIAAYRSWKAEN